MTGSMTRRLTPEEILEIKIYLKQAENTTFAKIAKHFTDKFETNVTEFCIQHIITSEYLKSHIVTGVKK